MYIWYIRSLAHAVVYIALFASGFGDVRADGQDTTLLPHVRKIERALSERTLPVIRTYLHPQRTFVDILGKPASYLSTNQAVAVIEMFLRTYVLAGYSMDVVKEAGPAGIALGTLRIRSSEGVRSLQLSLTFSKNSDWHINRIVIR